MSSRLVFLLRRRSELSREEFQAYWRTTHAPLVAARAELLGIRRYQQVHTVDEIRAGDVAVFDGIAELWVDRATSTGTGGERAQAGAELLADERNFIELTQSPIWYADERPMREGPKDGLRITAALRRKAGTTRADFKDYWQNVHAPLLLGELGALAVTSYVQLDGPDGSVENPLAVARDAPDPFDGMAEIYAGPVTAPQDEVDAAYARLAEDAARFVDPAQSPVFRSEVHVIVDR
jgi:uncharacterized protein (TIGR02118 family)